ncbi:MAG: FAD-dependent oxidoreductase [Myxococcota bacterium]|nr:FAD-dependent oxidoreductase [Myxococcota bacterium]MDP6242952.1 FAD-dependent oxidoreductase [Myxococcota bacterium]MDP7073982.1 FAD-dependent oxidoreductase [Myxococcota bacterium]MDP7300244.1 FAD-dependent oxidoreductase [Myxococcota bacterium]MDP7431445.1 FAD-dependent oxidoreductase [Myxococcota bacterium]
MSGAESLPARAGVVVIGGGIVGCSVAYHLVRRDFRDVVLLERKQLTCGTTWHAAGLVGQLRATHNMTRLAQYSAQLYARLAEETGQETGFKRTGSLSVARGKERLEELLRGASMARCFGLEVEVLPLGEVAERWPHARVDDLAGAVYLPGDGSASPVDTTRALAAGARAGGVRIFENTGVSDVICEDGRVRGVVTEHGEISCEHVVNAAGMWAREIGNRSNVNVPLHAAEHFYVITEPIPNLPAQLPTLRDPDGCAYFKCEAGGRLLVGFFEPVAKPWGMQGIPEDFAFDSLPEDWEHLEPVLESAAERVPALREVGIRTFFNGPESFTPDDRYLLGPAPGLRGYWVAAGFNSVGIQSAGGAGKVLADWMLDGAPPMDLWDVDLRRMLPFQGDPEYLRERCVEGLGLLYAMHWPFRQYTTARNVRCSALHRELADAGACFGELAGWERANWFDPGHRPGEPPPRYEYSYGRQNWFEHSAAEHRAAREQVVVFDQSSFAKFRVEGADALRVLNRVCANDVDVEPGTTVYTQWLNERGGIEADLSVTRCEEASFLVVSGAATALRDQHWLRDHLPDGSRAVVREVTEELAVLSVMGPGSRELLAPLCGADLSNAAFPYRASRQVEIAGVALRATRISYVGELGWELYVAAVHAPRLYRALRAAGARNAGYHALDSLRMEKGYRHWGHDVTPDDTPLEAGLGFAVAFGKAEPFLGRDALLRQREAGLERRLLSFALDDSEPLLLHDEPIWRDGRLVGRTTSGAYGHSLGRSLALGYVEWGRDDRASDLCASRWEIEIACRRHAARASLRPFYDPKSERLER